MWRLLIGHLRDHTLLMPWTTELVLCFQSYFWGQQSSFNNLSWVLGISKVGLLGEQYILYFQRWTWVAGACAGGPRAAGLVSPSQVSSAHRLRRRCKDTAKHFILTYVLLTCFGIESQQSFPMFQQIYHACQLLKFISGPCLYSCPFLGKKKYLPEASNDYQWLQNKHKKHGICCANVVAGVWTACPNAPWCVRVSAHKTGLLCGCASDYTQHSEMFHT